LGLFAHFNLKFILLNNFHLIFIDFMFFIFFLQKRIFMKGIA